MIDNRQLIKKTRNKFIFLTFLGLGLVLLISGFGLTLHLTVIKKQENIQTYLTYTSELRKNVNQLGHLIESFLSSPPTSLEVSNRKKKEIIDTAKSIQKVRYDFLHTLTFDESSLSQRIIKILNSKQLVKRFEEFEEALPQDKNLEDRRIVFFKKELIEIPSGADEGIGRVIYNTSSLILKELNASLSDLKTMGYVLVGLCILQVLLVWVIVFRPLYTTVLEQHERINNSMIQVEEASRARTQFLANISHEIRTPMTAILGYADILQNENVSLQERSDAVRIVNSNAHHLLSLLDDLLDISKMEALKFEVAKSHVDLSLLINEVFSLIHIKAEEKNLELSISNRGNIPRSIYTDEKRLRQILYNLIGNAIKFTSRGSITLTAMLAKNQKLIFDIEDTGIGIPKEKIKSLFKPFEQVDSSSKRARAGTGLGLALSKGLAQALGGDIEILRTEPGKGSVFRLSIDPGPNPTQDYISHFTTSISETQNTKSLQKVSLEGLKILVVDDAKENARLFKGCLSRAGAEVTLAYRGQQAIELVEKNDFNVVFLDLQMPEMDGYEALEQIKKRRPQLAVAALTGHAMEEEIRKTSQAGFREHITKPVEPNELVLAAQRLSRANV